MNEVTLTLTIQELDYVMNSLGMRPFNEVNGLIQKCVNQANSQLKPDANVVDIKEVQNG
jgi:hypothetical protein